MYSGSACQVEHPCPPGYNEDKDGKCQGQKVMMANGAGPYGFDGLPSGVKTEILDLTDPNFVCRGLPDFPDAIKVRCTIYM